MNSEMVAGPLSKSVPERNSVVMLLSAVEINWSIPGW